MVDNQSNSSRKKLEKKFAIDLHIKMLRIKVQQQTPVYVIWSRGKLINYNSFHRPEDCQNQEQIAE
jgi:hypothetical protein